MTIEVTQDDIDKGDEADCDKCPIALAINRATGKRWCVVWHRCWLDEDHSPSIDLPESAVDFIQDFDNDQSVKPFSFELAI